MDVATTEHLEDQWWVVVHKTVTCSGVSVDAVEMFEDDDR